MAAMKRPGDDDPLGDRPDGDGQDMPMSGADGETLQPRRLASAEFIVAGGVGAEAAMREAMDPANQSLADALRLSYRVLQVVMVILIVLFLFSGAKTIEAGQSGVRLWLGRIVGEGRGQALEPGFHWSLLPYPAGEFIVLDVVNLDVDLQEHFWPGLGNSKLADAIASASARRPLMPEKDGFLLVRGGDIAHLKLTAKYQVDRPEQLLVRMSTESSREIVELTLKRAVIAVAATLNLQQLTELSDDVRTRIQAEAQAALDRLASGITLTEITIPDVQPALAVARSRESLLTARQEADKAIEEARLQAEDSLIRAAGANHARFSAAIRDYEDAVERDDAALVAASMDRLHQLLEGGEASGRVVEIIEAARREQSSIEITFGAQARLFNSLLAAYRQNPELVINQRWLETYTQLMSSPDAETIYVPDGVGAARIKLSGLDAVARLRRELRLQLQQQLSIPSILDASRWLPTFHERAEPGKAGFRLRQDEKTGEVVAPRQLR
jgi:modulator of FtsH protease HflK